MTAAGAAPAGVREPRSANRGYRGDIQGLRAVAVGLVLLYHAVVPFVPGGYVGVDVFFVISGFLITGLILKEVRETGRLRLGHFYARRARRLLPATALVFVAVTATSLWLLPASRWLTIAQDILASNLYVVNWQLASRATDYRASEQADSPLQHFWSLAVEEQFYVVWPVLIVALVVASRRARGTAPSNGLFLAGILVAALSFSAQTTFPGLAALLPTLGAAGVLAAGTGDGEARLRPLDSVGAQLVGSLSYSLYLWHWPVLVAAHALLGEPDGSLSVRDGLLAVLVSFVPASLAYRFVEKPLHQSRRLGESARRSGLLALVCLAIGATCAAVLLFSVPRSSGEMDGEALGAMALGANPRDSVEGLHETHSGPMTPEPAEAGADNPRIYADGCHQDQKSVEPEWCSLGDLGSDVVLALVGDSHAAHWEPALETIAEENEWRLDVYTKSACFFGDAEVWLSTVEGRYTACRTWTDRVVDRLVSDPPTLVLTSMSGAHGAVVDGARVSRPEVDQVLSEGLARTLSTLSSAGSEVALLVDTPWIGHDVPDCVSLHEGSEHECAADREEALERSAGEIQRDAVERVPSAHLIDLNDWVCPAEECAPVIGDVLVWRDAHHLTATYARSLAPALEDALVPIVDE